MWLNCFGDGFDYWNCDAIAELTISLRIGYGYLPRFRKAHQSSAFAGCQSARVSARALAHQNFAAVFVIASRQRSGDIVWRHQPKTKTVPFGFVLRRVLLEIIPKLVRQGILGVHPGFGTDGERIFGIFGAILRMQNRIELGPNFGKLQFAPRE